MECPCCSGFSFVDCCQPFLSGKRKAETAEALMRSRYSAYVVVDVNYIIATTHLSTRKLHDPIRLSNGQNQVLGRNWKLFRGKKVKQMILLAKLNSKPITLIQIKERKYIMNIPILSKKMVFGFF